MRIQAIVKPRAKKREVVQLSPGCYKVSVSAPAIDNKANRALMEALSEYFGVPLSKIRFVTGLKSKLKILDIENGL